MICKRCEQEKPEEDFRFKEEGIRDTSCKVCRKAQSKQWYENRKIWYLEGKLVLREHPKEKVCTTCGKSHPLDFYIYEPILDYYYPKCKECRKVKKPTAKQLLESQGQRKCNKCGKIHSLSEYIHSKKHTCSQCRKIEYQKKHPPRILKGPRIPKNPRPTNCVVCGKLLSEGIHKHTCSKECWKENVKRTVIARKMALTPEERAAYNRKIRARAKNSPKAVQRREAWEVKKKYWADTKEEREEKNRKCRQKRKYARSVVRKQTDPAYKLKLRMTENIRNALQGRKHGSYKNYLGCDIHFFKSHLESLWTEGMSWDNYGIDGWHIDHYIPISFFDLSDEREAKMCYNYRNQRPLWAKENISKSNTLPEDFKTKYKELLLLLRDSAQK